MDLSVPSQDLESLLDSFLVHCILRDLAEGHGKLDAVARELRIA